MSGNEGAAVNDRYAVVHYPDDWRIEDRAAKIEAGGNYVTLSGNPNVFTVTEQLALGCTFTPLVALDAATVEALAQYLEAYPYRHKDFGGHNPEVEAAYNVLRQLLAQVGG